MVRHRCSLLLVDRLLVPSLRQSTGGCSSASTGSSVHASLFAYLLMLRVISWLLDSLKWIVISLVIVALLLLVVGLSKSSNQCSRVLPLSREPFQTVFYLLRYLFNQSLVSSVSTILFTLIVDSFFQLNSTVTQHLSIYLASCKVACGAHASLLFRTTALSFGNDLICHFRVSRLDSISKSSNYLFESILSILVAKGGHLAHNDTHEVQLVVGITLHSGLVVVEVGQLRGCGTSKSSIDAWTNNRRPGLMSHIFN
jgi:hypothetical protein